MKRLFCLVQLGALALLCGCVQYQSQIKIGSTSFRLPKDAKFDWLQASVPIYMTNGQAVLATLTITNGSFKMNPEIIDRVTAHDIAIVQAVGAVAAQVGGQAAKAAAGGL